MQNLKKSLTLAGLLILVLTFSSITVSAQKRGYSGIVNHLQTKYQAKKVKIPFMWLARFAVKIVRPAGVKSYNITLFENLKISRDTLDEEMQDALSDSLGAEWSPILRVRSRTGEQAYMYMRESGENFKIVLVTIERDEAAIIRATFNPEKLAEFLQNPRIFGISLDDGNKTASNEIKLTEIKP